VQQDSDTVVAGRFYPGGVVVDSLLAQFLGSATKRLKESDLVRNSA